MVKCDLKKLWLYFFSLLVTSVLTRKCWRAKYTEKLKQKKKKKCSLQAIQIHQTQLGDLKYTVFDVLRIQEQANDGL